MLESLEMPHSQEHDANGRYRGHSGLCGFRRSLAGGGSQHFSIDEDRKGEPSVHSAQLHYAKRTAVFLRFLRAVQSVIAQRFEECPAGPDRIVLSFCVSIYRA